MTPLETIKYGILNNDMESVVTGYNKITGEKLTVPKQEVVSYQYSQPPNNDFVETVQPVQQVSSENKTRAMISEPYVPRRGLNLWTDEGEMPIGYTEKDRQDDLRAKNKGIAPRPKPYTPVRINCIKCGNMYDVNPIFTTGGVYSCDKCSRR